MPRYPECVERGKFPPYIWDALMQESARRSESMFLPVLQPVPTEPVLQDPRPVTFKLGEEVYALHRVVDGLVFGCKIWKPKVRLAAEVVKLEYKEAVFRKEFFSTVRFA